MITDIDLARWFGLLYAGAVVVAYLTVGALCRSRTGKARAIEAGSNLNIPSQVWWPVGIFALAVAVRLAPAILLPNGAAFDFASYKAVGDVVLRGGDVYNSPELLFRYPYLPLPLYFLGIAEAVASGGLLPLTLAIKAPLALLDGLTALVIYASVTKLSDRRDALIAGCLFALNPVSMLVTAYHGQFDSLPLLFIVMAWYLARFHAADRRLSLFLAALLVGIAILAKTWPILLLPCFVISMQTLRSKLIFCMASLVPAMLAALVYVALHPGSGGALLTRVAGYSGVAGLWGYASVVLSLRNLGLVDLRSGAVLANFLMRYTPAVMLLGIGLVFVLALRTRKDLLSTMLTTILVTLSLSVGFSTQYLVWPVPFASVLGEQILSRLYVVVAAAYMLATFLLVQLAPTALGAELEDGPLRLLGIGLWVVIIAWSVVRIRDLLAGKSPLRRQAAHGEEGC
ncbi:MAG: glycosyltransferase family 39 protein [Chloroflexota bacterium]|nr:glycosyltransferase family 39 protein [Chloroflexota bacterium]